MCQAAFIIYASLMNCFFCANPGGRVLYNCELYRIILVEDEFYPGYLRVVLNQHLRELSDLSEADNLLLYQAVIRCETVLRKILDPHKINIASFGNQTPHVHWHIIPRFNDDRHFPNPTWGEITNPHYIPSSELLKLVELVDKEFVSMKRQSTCAPRSKGTP